MIASPPARWRGTLEAEASTLALGAAFARAGLRRGAVFLRGELGTGKTTFVRGFLRELGTPGMIRSPTYTLVEEYRAGGLEVRHYDLYRLGSPEELEFLGLRDHLLAGSLCFFEWPERGIGMLPEPVLEVRLGHARDGARSAAATGRVVECVGRARDGVHVLDRLRQIPNLVSSL